MAGVNGSNRFDSHAEMGAGNVPAHMQKRLLELAQIGGGI